MKVVFVDLYQWFHVEKPEGANGTLQCWIQDSDKGLYPNRKRPGVLIVPGGGYNHVSLREGEPVAMEFLKAGYCTFILTYSVATVRFPVALREAAMAMRYIREQSGEFGVDPHMVTAIGFSAGGHLCGTLGTMYDCPEVADLGPAELLRPDALSLCYPVAVSWGNTHEGSFRYLCGEDAALRQRLSLDRLVRADMPPVFLWHTRDDGTVPVRNSLLLAQTLDSLGVEFALHIYRKGCHGLSTANSQVYPAHEIPEHSRDVAGWIPANIAFFEEIGIKCRDI